MMSSDRIISDNTDIHVGLHVTWVKSHELRFVPSSIVYTSALQLIQVDI